MQWYKFPDSKPPSGKRLLVIKQWLDAPYGQDGYNEAEAFWTEPLICIDISWDGLCWSNGGKGTYWTELPEMPDVAN